MNNSIKESNSNPTPTPTTSVVDNNILPLDFTRVQKLPDSHVWTTCTPPSSLKTDFIIPVIDLTNPNAPTLIKTASENVGMFQVTNHAIPLHLFRQIEHQIRSLFALPATQKLLAARSQDKFTGYGGPRYTDFHPKKMWYEGFTILGSPAEDADKLWPNQHTIFCEVVEEFHREMRGLSERIFGLMLKSLGLTEEDVEFLGLKEESKYPQGALQLNSYPVCPDPDRAMGLARHTDSALITLLHQAGASGLQFFGEGIGCVPVNPVDGAIVVNVGDFMQIITNGRFKSACHQVVLNKTRHRISVAYFYGPPKDVKVSPLMKLIDFDHPLLYRSVTWKEYVDAKAKYFDKAFDFIKNDEFMSN